MVYYYKKKIPSIDDIVLAKVENISQYGIEVSLNEYNGIRGFINCNEASRKKKVNLNTLFTVGKDVLLIVIQVDGEKKFIDLSKRMISDDDMKNFTSKYKLHIQLYNLFKQIYMKLNGFNSLEQINDEQIYKFMCGSLFEIQTEYENNYILEKILVKDTYLEPIDSIDFESIGFSKEDFLKILDDHIDNKVNKKKPELNETIKLKTYSPTGLADIKYSMDLQSFPDYNNLSADFDIKINYITGSIYSIGLIQKEYDLVGSNSITDAILIIKKEIAKRALEKKIQNQIVL